MAILLTLLPILAQIGPFTQPGAGTGPNVPHVEGRDQPRHPAPIKPPPAPPVPVVDTTCHGAIDSSPTEAARLAGEWIARSQGAELAAAQACMGQAQGRMGMWGEAELAFLAARDAIGKDMSARASYGAMAGNAALAGGHADRALEALTAAGQDAATLTDKTVAGEIAIDRARALVALKRESEARMALDQATADAPRNSDAWLLSATLWRRMGALDKAQAHIEKAAALAPADPAVGLEAGVIAALGNRDAAARKSWQSVLTTSPQSPEAAQAKLYLEQVPEPAALPNAPVKANAPRPATAAKAPAKPTTAPSPAAKPKAGTPATTARPAASKPVSKSSPVKPAASGKSAASGKAPAKTPAKPGPKASAKKPSKKAKGKS